jgi:hypothetical protein
MNKAKAVEAQVGSTERQRQLRIEQQIFLVTGDRAEAQRELGGISFKLVEMPNDPVLLEQIESLEAEIVGHTRKIERLEAAKAEATRLDTDEARKASLVRHDDLFESIKARLARQKVLAAKIVTTIESLAPDLAEYDVAAQDNSADTWALIKSVCAGNTKVADRHFDGLSRAVRGLAAVPGIVTALWASGLGRTGVSLRPWCEISSCGVIQPIDEAMAQVERSVLAKLRQLLDQRKAEVLGTAPAVKVPTAADRFIVNGAQLERAKNESFIAARNGDFKP